MSDVFECCGKPMTLSGKAGSKKARWFCRQCGRRTTHPEDPTEGIGYDAEQVAGNAERLRDRVKAGCRRFVITSAVNNTSLHQGFYALKAYCREWDAELVVIPISYKNISLYTASQEYKKWWHSDLAPYLVTEHVHIGGGTEVAGDIPISATAVNPLEGLAAIGGPRWQVVGHPQVGMKPIATPISERPKRLYSTGAVTLRNYSRTKLGAKGSFYHTYGAVVVEIIGPKRVLVRQLGLHGGGFYDIAGGEVRHYTASGSTGGHMLETLTMGDEHVGQTAKSVIRASAEMAERLRPRWLIRHDVLDGYAGSHHHRNNPLQEFAKHHTGKSDYAAELEAVVAYLNKTTPPGVQSIMVASNHHDHLLQWLNSTDVNREHQNALILAELQLQVRQAVIRGENPDPLRIYCEPRLNVDVKWLSRDEKFLVRGVDHSQHGDVGANGGRGSPKTFAQSTYKMTVGHSHSPSIEKGCYTVGKSTNRLEYERGLSTHAQAHCALYPDGKRTLVDIDRGVWFLEDKR